MNDAMVQQVLNAVDEGLAVEVTRGMVRIPSVCGDELAIAEYVQRTLRDLKVGEVWTQPVDARRHNVVWRLDGAGPGP